MKRITVISLLLGGLFLASAPASFAQAVPENYGQAMSWYERAAKAGDAEAQYYLGMMEEKGWRGSMRPEAAARWYERAARQGHAAAAFRLGMLYHFGAREGAPGVARDFKRAVQWYKQAAEKGLAEAAYNLALMTERGQGTPVDLAAAVKLYEQAAGGGVALASLGLSALYARGDGDALARDPVLSLMWLDLAMKGGAGGPLPGTSDTLAAFYGSLTQAMTPEQIAKALDLANGRWMKWNEKGRTAARP